ncbi:MAG TPA: NAD(P)(+) transhydrogenase (Re/Si-specific) subunit beta, partial [Bdellovibrionales bacterium]|nr:NAD(P)(+) transhydrogenase (Re/Si-specific) subunit beta [Bdellovibrionales bacterium]
MTLSPDIFALGYLVTTVLFIFGLKGLSSPKTALRGNRLAMIGMTLAVLITLIHPDVKSYTWIAAGLAGGLLIGTFTALKIQMTAMPQLVAALHSFVGLSAVLVAIGTFFSHTPEQLDPVLLTELGLGAIIGAITFTGSLIAFGKLQELLGSAPLVFKGQHLVNLLLGLVTLGLCAHFVVTGDWVSLLLMTGVSLVLGFLLVLPIGGADMPVVVSMLNSYSGWAASATGFTLGNQLLIATGALVGASGAILSYIMCKAMNRSFISVILGGFGAEGGGAAASGGPAKTVRSASVEDAAYFLGNSSKVIIVPGYGMAVSQAQHAIKELYQTLNERGVEVKFAIHPVAGRMPGHMNVLLAEADIPYDVVQEMEEINGEFATTDAVFV